MTGKTTYRSIPDLITDTGTTLQDDVDKANAFNVFFQKQTELQGNDRQPDTTGLPKNPHNFSSIETSPSEVYDILLSLPRRKHLDGMASQLTCYVFVPLVLQRVWPPFLTGHSQMVFFLLHGNWLFSLRFLKKDVWLDRTTTDQLLCFRLLAKSVKKLSTKSFITL